MRMMLGSLTVMLGVFLVIWGLDASDSLYSQVSRLVSGAPTDPSQWLLIGGFSALVIGMAMAFTRRHHHHHRTQ